MSKTIDKLKLTYRKYVSVLNFKTLLAVTISIVATWVCYYFNLIFNLDLTLISVAVIFPLVFTLGSAFQRRERALEHLGRAKAALASIKYCFSYSKKVGEEEKKKISEEIHHVKSELIKFLHSKSDDKEDLNQSIAKVQSFIDSHKDTLGRSVSLRVYRLMRDVIMGVENSIAIKVHGTPQSIRAYCEVFIYIFPFFYAPTLIKNILFPDHSRDMIIAHLTTFDIDSRYGLIVYGLNILISFLLITLFNIQEQIENPYDQYGMDDIILENYLIDY